MLCGGILGPGIERGVHWISDRLPGPRRLIGGAVCDDLCPGKTEPSQKLICLPGCSQCLAIMLAGGAS
jgi:hypothetical protein